LFETNIYNVLTGLILEWWFQMRHPKEARELVVKLRREGKSLDEIRKATGKSKGTIYYWIKDEKKPDFDRSESARKSWDSRREALNIGHIDRLPDNASSPKIENMPMIMQDTHWKGVLASLKIQERAAEKGYVVSIPSSEVRYDLIMDDGEKLSKIQVKYVGNDCAKTSNAINIALRKSAYRGQKERRYSAKDIDFLAAYVAKLDMVIMIPISEFDSMSGIQFRLAPAKSGQTKNTRNIYDYIW
jgi:hypothetical protein